MIRTFSLILMMAALAACQPEGIPDNERVDGVIEGPGPTETPPHLNPHCPNGTVVISMAGPTCTNPTPDAGKACTKASDCSGACMADTMTCTTMSPMFGCYEVVMEDGQKAGLCVD